MNQHERAEGKGNRGENAIKCNMQAASQSHSVLWFGCTAFMLTCYVPCISSLSLYKLSSPCPSDLFCVQSECFVPPCPIEIPELPVPHATELLFLPPFLTGVELASLCLKQSLLTAHAEGTSSKAAMKQRWGYFPEGWSAHNSL